MSLTIAHQTVTLESMYVEKRHDAGARALERAEWQPALFAHLNRAKLLTLRSDWPCKEFRLRVHGNHGFAPVASALRPFATWNGLHVDVTYTPQDDTLSLHIEGDADVELVWFDRTRLRSLTDEQVASWLVQRLEVLRAATSNPIVCAVYAAPRNLGAALDEAHLASVHLADMQSVADSLGDAWLDERASSLTGTSLSNKASLLLARALACQWLPASLMPPIKAIAVDLDNTLFAGVLAEDGIQGVVLTPSHRRLHEQLLNLQQRGVFLALVTRNEPGDVQALFRERNDFPLAYADFSSIQASWEDKADALARVLDDLQIGPEALVFVDDNPGELEDVASRLPVITVHAPDDADATWSALSCVAGLFQWERLPDSSIRTADLKASKARKALRANISSPAEYLRNLKIELRLALNPAHEIGRIHELIQKTNQFNLSLRRSNQVHLARLLESAAGRIVTVKLSDRLSDSGTVAVLVGTCTAEMMHVIELCVSCRALGRRLEDTLITEALRLAVGSNPPSAVKFTVSCGPRNAPARRWLASFIGNGADVSDGDVVVPYSLIRHKKTENAITVFHEAP